MDAAAESFLMSSTNLLNGTVTVSVAFAFPEYLGISQERYVTFAELKLILPRMRVIMISLHEVHDCIEKPFIIKLKL